MVGLGGVVVEGFVVDGSVVGGFAVVGFQSLEPRRSSWSAALEWLALSWLLKEGDSWMRKSWGGLVLLVVDWVGVGVTMG